MLFTFAVREFCVCAGNWHAFHESCPENETRRGYYDTGVLIGNLENDSRFGEIHGEGTNEPSLFA